MADDPALDALAAALGPARVLGIDTGTAEAILHRAGERAPGTRGDGAHEQAAVEAQIALTNLAEAAGLFTRGVRGLIPDPTRRRGVDGAISEIALLLDMETFEAQALALVRRDAYAQGLGPLRVAEALRTRFSPRAPAPAVPDPQAHLLAWKARGGLVRAADQVRRAIADALPSIPQGLRDRYAQAGSGDLEERLLVGVDRVVQEAAPAAARPPGNRAWRLVGRLQWLNLALFVLALVSLAGVFMLLLCPLFAVVLAIGLNENAQKRAGIWSSRIENEVRRGVRVVVEAEAFAPLAPLEAARARLGEAWYRARPADGEAAAG